MVMPKTGQFITFGDKDYLPKVQPSTRTVNLTKSARERWGCSLELTSARVSNQRTCKFNNLIVQKRPVKTKKGRHSTEKQPDKNGPEGRADVHDGRASHVDAIKVCSSCFESFYSNIWC